MRTVHLSILIILFAALVYTGCESVTEPNVSNESTLKVENLDVQGESHIAFPSTNDNNRNNGFPHVNLVDAGIGEVTLEFVNNTNSLSYFEYRIDGEVLTSGTEHPLNVPVYPYIHDDYIYPGVNVDGRGVPDPVLVEQTFEATEYVEVRLTLGGERDWDFDWVQFDVLPDVETKNQCKKGGWEAYGFKNQGQCIRFVNTGKDSRE